MFSTKVWKNIIFDSLLGSQYLYNPISNNSHNVVICLEPLDIRMRDYPNNVMKSYKIFHYLPFYNESDCFHECVVSTRCPDVRCGRITSLMNMYTMAGIVQKYAQKNQNILLYAGNNTQNVIVFILCCMIYDSGGDISIDTLSLTPSNKLYVNCFIQLIIEYVPRKFIYVANMKSTVIQNSPYQIIDVARVNNSNANKGRLTLSIAPGKKDTKWNRDLQTDLDVIKLADIDIIVCLLEWSELRLLNIENYPKIAQEQGLMFYHLPIKDRGSPTQKDIEVLIPSLVEHLTMGENILVHCRGGLGRAGTITACCLCHFGFTSESAISSIRQNRPGAIQTRKQEECVDIYYSNLLNSIKNIS